MIRFDDVTVTYAGADTPTLSHVDLDVGEGELCLVIGPTGSGKSTLLGAVNGLVPRFTGGLLEGVVTVAGRRTDQVPPRELADVVGVVAQDPMNGFVTDTVEDELAYVMENLGLAPEVMRRRVEDVVDLLRLQPIRRRPLVGLSGGQAQRVAIGSVLTANPRVLVLDEPTSALDPAAAEDVLAALTRLVHDLGLTVVVAEHRLERVVPFADRIVALQPDGSAVSGTPQEIMGTSSVAPPVELGRLAGWSPLPLNVRDARREVTALRNRLATATPPTDRRVGGEVVAAVSSLRVHYGPIEALAGVSTELRGGEVTAIMGRNGAGKSTLLSVLAGVREPSAGRARLGDHDPTRLEARDRVRTVGLVPQQPGILIERDSVGAESAGVDDDSHLDPGTTRAMLDALVPGLDDDVHPRDLSEGQRLCLALAIVLAPDPTLVMLDEPTRGLDYRAKRRLVAILAERAAIGHAVVVATHDVEVVAQLADRVIVLADGEIVADSDARDVVVHSPVFSPQVAKILAPEPWLTVDEVRAVLVPSGADGAS